jgi:hypothetical protein
MNEKSEYNEYVRDMQFEHLKYIKLSDAYFDYYQESDKSQFQFELNKLWKQMKQMQRVLDRYKEFEFYRKEYSRLPKKIIIF